MGCLTISAKRFQPSPAPTKIGAMSRLNNIHRGLLPALLLASCSLWAGCSVESSETPSKAVPTITAEMTASITALGIPNASVQPNGLLCAGQLSQEQMEGLKGLGFGTFVSLRLPTEKGAGWEEAYAAESGTDFQRLPTAGAAGVDEAAARGLADVLAAAERPAVLYCGSSNRVGALLALKAFHVDAVPAEEALALGAASGMKSLEPKVRGLLGLEPKTE
ncbi:MAG: protein tyrosine phosphatase (PTP) superfamily phosphohydrolase (DUF442 family) [Paracoccaceae bacterium]